MRVCNAFAAAIVFVAIPMDVDDSAVPAATPTAGEYPAAVMNAHPSAIGRSVPVTAMAIATGPTCARASTSMESPPVITRTHRPRFPRRTTPSGSGMKFAPEGPRRRPTTISPTSGAWTSSPSLPPHASAMNVIQSRAISYSVEAIAVPSDSSRHGGGVPSAVVLPVGFSSRPRVDRSAAARAATRRRRRPRARVWLEARSRSRAVRRVVVLSRRGTLHVRGAVYSISIITLANPELTSVPEVLLLLALFSLLLAPSSFRFFPRVLRSSPRRARLAGWSHRTLHHRVVFISSSFVVTRHA